MKDILKISVDFDDYQYMWEIQETENEIECEVSIMGNGVSWMSPIKVC